LINFDCFENYDFCSLVLSDKGFRDFLDSYNVIFFVGLVNKNLEIKYKHIFRKQLVYPCLMLVTYYKKQLTIIESINQMNTAIEIENIIRRNILEYSDKFNEEIAEEMRRENDRLLVREQNQAFQQSLESDKLKEKQRKEEEELKISKIERKREFIREKRLEALAGLVNLPETKDKQACTIIIRLLDGSRQEKKNFLLKVHLNMYWIFYLGLLQKD